VPFDHYTSERLTRPYSGELPACAVLSQRATIARSPRSHTAQDTLSQGCYVSDRTLKPLIIMPAFVLYAGDGGGFVQAG